MRIHSKKRGAWAWGGPSKVTGQSARKDRKVSQFSHTFFASIFFGDSFRSSVPHGELPVPVASVIELRLPLHTLSISVLFAFYGL
jgi:hypothetical protein